ncbi:MAG: MFS transporter [Chloroflexi bacterium]|nr:MFS transporter [Chloroflexota bacterium]
MRLTLLFAFAGFVESMAFGHYLTFLPILVRDLGVAEIDIAGMVGLLSTASLLAGLPLVPFWGAWADKYSRKAIIVRSAVVEAVLFLLLAFVGDTMHLFLLVPLVGLVLGNTGVMLAEITDRAPRARLGFAISLVGASGPLGLAVGPALGGPVVDHLGVQVLFLVDALLSGVAVAALVLWYHERADRRRTTERVMTLVRRSLTAVIRTPLARTVFLTYFLLLMGQRVVAPFLALFVEHINGPLLLGSTVGIVAGVYGLAAAVGAPIAGAAADRRGFGRVLLVAIGITAVTSGLAALTEELLPFMVDYAILGIGFATAGSMLFAMLATGLPDTIRSSVLNLSLVPMYLSGIVGSLLAVRILEDASGDLRVLWLVSAVCIALALVPAWSLRGIGRARGTLGG